MRFHGLDLNLLVALEALLKEHSVTAAGERLNMSQSGMSGAVRRLREYFEDDLIVAAGRGSVLTPRAAALIEPVRAALAQIELTITAGSRFVPQESERLIRIAATDYMLWVLLAPALRALEKTAPRMTFALRFGGGATIELLERGEVDIVFVGDHAATPHHPSRAIMSDDYVGVAALDNPATAHGLTTEVYFSSGHVSPQLGAAPYMQFENWLLRTHNARRRVEVLAPSFAAVPTLVSGTRRLGTMHRRHAVAVAADHGLRIFELPFESPSAGQLAQWNRLSANDPALVWLIDQFEDMARRLPPTAPVGKPAKHG